MKKILGSIVITIGMFGAPSAQAILPVTDVAHIAATAAGHTAVSSAIAADAAVNTAGHAATNATGVAGWAQDLANFVEEKVKWVNEQVHWLKTETELGQSVMTLMDTKEKVQTSIDKLNGVRLTGQHYLNGSMDVGDGYLPDDYQSGMANALAGVSPFPAKTGLVDNFKKFTSFITGVDGDSDDMLDDQINRAALNRSMAELAYMQGSMRHASMVGMSAEIDAAVEAKDVMDLQARIQLMQAQVENEHTKVTSMLLMQGAQADVERLKEKQARLNALKMSPTDAVIAVVTGAAAWNM